MGTVPGAAASLQCPRKVLSSQPASFVAIPAQCHRPSQAGPSPPGWRIRDPPWDREEEGSRQAGRRNVSSFGDPAARRLCDPRLVCCLLWATVSIT